MSNPVGSLPNNPTLEELCCKLREIEERLKKNLANLHRQLSILESRPELSSKIEIFKQEIEIRAEELEMDVRRLRADVFSIKDVLGLNQKKQVTRNS